MLGKAKGHYKMIVPEKLWRPHRCFSNVWKGVSKMTQLVLSILIYVRSDDTFNQDFEALTGDVKGHRPRLCMFSFISGFKRILTT